MSGEFPRKYWWLVLIVVPIVVALIPYLIPKSEGPVLGPGTPTGQGTPTSQESKIPPQVPQRGQPNCGKIWLHANPSSVTVPPGGEVSISLLATSGDANTPITEAEVALGAGGGAFQATGNRFEHGVTDSRGVYRTAWRAPVFSGQSGKFPYVLDFQAKKPGCEVGEAKITVDVISQ